MFLMSLFYLMDFLYNGILYNNKLQNNIKKIFYYGKITVQKLFWQHLYLFLYILNNK